MAPGEPQFFTDRGLGSHLVPDGLRALGWVLTTMDERYGKDASQRVQDIDWIREAAGRGECMLTGDIRIARRPAEARTVWMTEARVFALPSGTATGPDKLARYVAQARAVMRWALRVPGPFVASVGKDGLRRLGLAYPPR